MTSTLALAATSLSTVCEPMKPAPPVTATRTFVAAPLAMTREHTRSVHTLPRGSNCAGPRHRRRGRDPGPAASRGWTRGRSHLVASDRRVLELEIGRAHV